MEIKNVIDNVCMIDHVQTGSEIVGPCPFGVRGRTDQWLGVMRL
jgi:hypothetical protein